MQIFKKLKNIKLRRVLQIFGGLVIVLTLFRFVALDYWWIRVFDFPHVQLTILTYVAFFAYFIKFDFKWRNDYIFAIMMLACMVYQTGKIYIYTPLAPYEIQDTTLKNPKNTLSIFTANVLQKNENHELLNKQILNQDSDLLLFTETDKKWQKAIKSKLPKEYLYKVEVPLDNTYGMLLYSRLPLVNPKIEYKVDDSIPSISTKIRLASGDLIQVYTIHPTPPMPQHNPLSTDRDKEMMLTALEAMNSKLPTIVIGDFNDVAWSQTTSLFQRVSGLLDPRKGRGLYNTFNAKNILMRWPLDHVFISPDFRIINIERTKSIDSDHFPVYAYISLEPEKAEEQTPSKPTEKDIKRAKEQIKGSSVIPDDIY